jgi:hypothetical protein
VGWLLAEMDQRFGFALEGLARRFDRGVTWVSRRLALVELLPEASQQPPSTRKHLISRSRSACLLRHAALTTGEGTREQRRIPRLSRDLTPPTAKRSLTENLSVRELGQFQGKPRGGQ